MSGRYPDAAGRCYSCGEYALAWAVDCETEHTVCRNCDNGLCGVPCTG